MSRNLQARPEHAPANVFSSQRLALNEPDVLRLNARTVELIARPGKAEELRVRLCEQMAQILRSKDGFEGVFVMASHQEPRLFVLATLWSTMREAEETRWELDPAFRRLIGNLVDVCARVQTYETFLPVVREAPRPANLQFC